MPQRGTLSSVRISGRAGDHGTGFGSGITARRCAAAICSDDNARCAAFRNDFGERAAAGAGTQQPGQSRDAVARYAGAEQVCRAEHRLTIGIASRGGFRPPRCCSGRVAIDFERIVINHAEARHCRSGALLRCGNGPMTCLDGIQRNAVAFEQHPTQHVLRRPVAGLGRRAVKLRGTRVILFDTLAFEIKRCQISLPDRVERFGSQRQPAQRQSKIALDAEPLGKASADIVLGPGDAGLGQRSPDGKRSMIVTARRRFISLGHARRDISLDGHRRVSGP